MHCTSTLTQVCLLVIFVVTAIRSLKSSMTPQTQPALPMPVHAPNDPSHDYNRQGM